MTYKCWHCGEEIKDVTMAIRCTTCGSKIAVKDRSQKTKVVKAR